MRDKPLHRQHSWARLCTKAGEVLAVEKCNNASETPELPILLWCILGASGVGLMLAGVLHLWQGLFG
jgi:hypothetical protein